MSKVKKLLAIVLALAMIMGMSVTTFATTTTYEDAIRVYGIEAGEGETVTVNAYQIIKYDTTGKYVPVINGTIDEVAGNLNPTANNVLALSERIGDLGTPVSLTKVGSGEGAYYTTQAGSSLAVGTWMIIVTGSDDYIYNPAIVSVNQTAEGIKYGELNLTTDSWGTDVWLKKSEPTIEKTALTSDVQGVQYGDIIQFQLKATIPSYADNKENIVFTISDNLDGLALVVDEDHPVVATLAGQSDSTLTRIVNNAFSNGNISVAVEFSEAGDAYIREHGGEEVIITYFAKVTEDAKVTVSELTNDATLEYSTEDDTNTKADDTKHYTFGIDTTFSGGTITENKTGEFIKIDSNGNVVYTENPGEVTVTNGNALAGAVFELHIGSATGALFKDASGATQFTTDPTGRLEIVGLDSDVDYYLVEVQAPTGYTINNTAVKVKINATFDGAGILTGYSVVIGEGDDSATTNYNYNYQTGETTIRPGVNNPYGFKNTTLSTLPSTGGIGTTIFTIGGCVIMIAAAGLYFASRRRQENK